VIGLKSTAGSLGNLLGPALMVLLTPVASPLVVFMVAAALVAMVTMTAGLALRLPAGGHVSQQIPKAAVEQ
jgi:hypothetical protein